jgi:hypothetical protein
MFNSVECKWLAMFCDACDKTTGSRFMRTFFDQAHHFSIGTLPDGRVVDEYPRYDDDDFRAFLTHYRKLRSVKEPTELFRIIKILKRKGTEADRSMLDCLKNEVKEEGRSWWGAMHPHEGYITQQRLEDLILNGEVFHSEMQKKDELCRVIGNIPFPKAVAFFNYMRVAMTVLSYAQKVAALIRERGYLAQV